MLHGRTVTFPVWLRFTGFASAVMCWLVAMIRFDVRSWDAHPTVPGAIVGWLLVLGGTLLFSICTLGMPSKFVPRWFAYLGRISYGLYIFHSLIFFLIFDNVGPYLAYSSCLAHRQRRLQERSRRYAGPGDQHCIGASVVPIFRTAFSAAQGTLHRLSLDVETRNNRNMLG